MPDSLLGIYLNDHLLGATAGLELFRRASRTQRDQPAGAALARLTPQVAAARHELLGVMTALGVPHRRYKVVAGWGGEKLGRLKLNGRLLRRSPLSDLWELEALRLGLTGQVAMWTVLVELAPTNPHLDAGALDSLRSQATAWADELEELRVQTAMTGLQP